MSQDNRDALPERVETRMRVVEELKVGTLVGSFGVYELWRLGWDTTNVVGPFEVLDRVHAALKGGESIALGNCYTLKPVRAIEPDPPSLTVELPLPPQPTADDWEAHR